MTYSPSRGPTSYHQPPGDQVSTFKFEGTQKNEGHSMEQAEEKQSEAQTPQTSVGAGGCARRSSNPAKSTH